MYLTLPQNTVYYRIEKEGRTAGRVLSGKGAFFGRKKGGRYNASRQRTVYASADVLASIAETAFYEAVAWQQKIGQQLLANQNHLGELISHHRLWAFQLNHLCRVVDLLDQQAAATFGYPPYVLWNPSREDYLPTQDIMEVLPFLSANSATGGRTDCQSVLLSRTPALKNGRAIMDAVFHYPHPPGTAVQGVQAPSVRSAVVNPPSSQQPIPAAYRPHQHVFVLLANQQRGLPAQIADSWNLDIEFVDENGQSRSQTSAELSWLRPRFRIQPLRGQPMANTIPAYTLRHGAQSIQPGVWNLLDIRFA